MKIFNASQLSHDRREILTAAKSEGCIIQSKNTNGEVLEEFIMISNNGQSIYSLFEGHEDCDDPQCQMCSFDW